MEPLRAMAGLAAAMAVGGLLVSGGSGADPQTPTGLSGLPAPFLGTAVVGHGERTMAVDAYGDIVDLREPGPAGRARVAVSAERQGAGTVAADEAIVARAGLGAGRTPPFWRADSILQRYVAGSNVLRTVARFGGETAVVVLPGGDPRAARADRRWLAGARPLGVDAPAWARAMCRRSLLTLRALTDRRTGAVAAGARDGWAYVWPRDAAAVAMAFASAGYVGEARRVVRFLAGLDLSAAARFRGTGAPVPGRDAQGDAAGWVAAAATAAGMRTAPGRGNPMASIASGIAWRGRADYQEGDSDDYLGNAIASAADGPKTGLYGGKSARRPRGGWILSAFGASRGLARMAGNPGSGLDSAAAWAVRPFSMPVLYPAARKTLLRLVAQRGRRFGIVPSESWHGGNDPWTAPTAWTAWALAALAREVPTQPGRRGRRAAAADRRAALSLMADLRRAATPLGLLPERVDARTGLPTSTTPLAWSHAFAILAIRELWPVRR
jgi:Glycosyl hydrolases family 15